MGIVGPFFLCLASVRGLWCLAVHTYSTFSPCGFIKKTGSVPECGVPVKQRLTGNNIRSSLEMDVRFSLKPNKYNRDRSSFFADHLRCSRLSASPLPPPPPRYTPPPHVPSPAGRGRGFKRSICVGRDSLSPYLCPAWSSLAFRMDLCDQWHRAPSLDIVLYRWGDN